ncbi:MAG: hypothetical protein R2751_10250 [Bacteroidales bacterium]
MNHRHRNFPRTLLIVLASLFTLAGFGQQNADETEEARARREKWEQEVLYRLRKRLGLFARYRAENDSLPPLAPGEQRVESSWGIPSPKGGRWFTPNSSRRIRTTWTGASADRPPPDGQLVRKARW